MKQISVYKFEAETKLKLDLELVKSHVFTPLSDLQMEKVGLVPVYNETYVDTTLQGYTIFKICIAKRKAVKADTLEREFQRKLKQKGEQGEKFDMDTLLMEVEDELTRMQDCSEKEFLVFIDHVNNRIMVDASRADAEYALSLLHGLVETPFTAEVLMFEPAIMQKLLTQYVVRPNTIPEPFIVGEHVELGKKAIIEKKAPPSNVIVKKQDVTSAEVINHIGTGLWVNKLELDSDGVIFVKVDNTGFFSGVSFEEALKYKEDPDIPASLNFISEWQVKLPEVTKMLNVIYQEIDNVSL